MDDEERRRALLALELLVRDGRDDDALAARIGSHEEAARCLARLCGHVVQLLAAHRGEPVADTARFVRHTIRRARRPSVPAR